MRKQRPNFATEFCSGQAVDFAATIFRCKTYRFCDTVVEVNPTVASPGAIGRLCLLALVAGRYRLKQKCLRLDPLLRILPPL
jgi:hypothetical protein